MGKVKVIAESGSRTRRAPGLSVLIGLCLVLGVGVLVLVPSPSSGLQPAADTPASSATAPLVGASVAPQAARGVAPSERASPSLQGFDAEASSAAKGDYLPANTPSVAIDHAARIHADAKALTEAGLTAGVAAEVTMGIDDLWDYVHTAKLVGPRFQCATDILLSIVPDLPQLIREGSVEVYAQPRSPHIEHSDMQFTFLPQAGGFRARIDGRDMEVRMLIKNDGQRAQPLWRALAEKLKK